MAWPEKNSANNYQTNSPSAALVGSAAVVAAGANPFVVSAGSVVRVPHSVQAAGVYPLAVSAALVAVGSVAVASQAPAHPVVVQVAAGGKDVSPTLSANTTYAHSWAHNVGCRRTPSAHGHYCQSKYKSNSRRRSLIKQ